MDETKEATLIGFSRGTSWPDPAGGVIPDLRSCDRRVVACCSRGTPEYNGGGRDGAICDAGWRYRASSAAVTSVTSAVFFSQHFRPSIRPAVSPIPHFTVGQIFPASGTKSATTVGQLSAWCKEITFYPGTDNKASRSPAGRWPVPGSLPSVGQRSGDQALVAAGEPDGQYHSRPGRAQRRSNSSLQMKPRLSSSSEERRTSEDSAASRPTSVLLSQNTIKM